MRQVRFRRRDSGGIDHVEHLAQGVADLVHLFLLGKQFQLPCRPSEGVKPNCPARSLEPMRQTGQFIEISLLPRGLHSRRLLAKSWDEARDDLPEVGIVHRQAGHQGRSTPQVSLR